jgi:hypothetical protein
MSMPSSNFLRSRWLPYLVMAVGLGCVSPAIGRLFDFADPATRNGLLYWWFMGIPVEVDLLVWPTEEYQDLLWAAVFTVQYLLVFAAGAFGVLLMQRRAARKSLPPLGVPPERQQAFETAAAMYNTRDGW